MTDERICPSEDKWMTAKEAAITFRTTEGRLAADRCHGIGLPFFRFGKKILYKYSECEAALKDGGVKA